MGKAVIHSQDGSKIANDKAIMPPGFALVKEPGKEFHATLPAHQAPPTQPRFWVCSIVFDNHEKPALDTCSFPGYFPPTFAERRQWIVRARGANSFVSLYS